MIFLPYLANTTGWIVTEMGRQPWVVYGLLLTTDGVSPSVSAASVWFTGIGFTLVYGLLAGVAFFLIHKFARPGVPPSPPAPESDDSKKPQDAWAY